MSASPGPRRTWRLVAWASSMLGLLVLVWLAFGAERSTDQGPPSGARSVESERAASCTFTAGDETTGVTTDRRNPEIDVVSVTTAQARSVVEPPTAPFLKPGPCVRGRVTSRDVERAHVWIGIVQVFASGPDGLTRLSNLAIDRTGAFELSGLPRRALRISVTSSGFESYEGEFQPGTAEEPAIVEIELRSTPRLELRLESEPGVAWRDVSDTRVAELIGRLRPFLSRTRPVVGAAVPSHDDPIRARRVASRSSDRAAWWDFELDSWSSGFCYLALGSRVLDVQSFDSERHVLTCLVPPSLLLASVGSVHVRLVDEARAPIPGAHVWLRSEDQATVDGRSDMHGDCLLEPASPGAVCVTVILPDRPRVEIVRVLSPAEHLDLRELTVESGITLSGRVEGPPELAGCWNVYARNLDPRRYDVDGYLESRAPEDAFAITALARGEYAVGFRTSPDPPDAQEVRTGRAPKWSYVDLRHGPVDPIVLRPSPEDLEAMRDLIEEIGPPPRKR